MKGSTNDYFLFAKVSRKLKLTKLFYEHQSLSCYSWFTKRIIAWTLDLATSLKAVQQLVVQMHVVFKCVLYAFNNIGLLFVGMTNFVHQRVSLAQV